MDGKQYLKVKSAENKLVIQNKELSKNSKNDFFSERRAFWPRQFGRENKCKRADISRKISYYIDVTERENVIENWDHVGIIATTNPYIYGTEMLIFASFNIQSVKHTTSHYPRRRRPQTSLESSRRITRSEILNYYIYLLFLQ